MLENVFPIELKHSYFLLFNMKSIKLNWQSSVNFIVITARTIAFPPLIDIDFTLIPI